MSEGPTPSGVPAVSVVVPIYNVAPYLAECLDSIAAQSFPDLEVICVDDGSTDDSGAIADAYAARDGRFRVVHQANAGLGAARNAGAALATGTYLGFVDSDDVLPVDAYARLHASLEASGSDFAVGDIRRLTSLGLRASPTFSPIYRPARRATHVTRDHALLRDRIAPNKLFRRSFFVEHDLAFPVGVLNEDIPVVIPAHALARAVDVLDVPVYLWRIRAGADRSITQRRLELRALHDRVAAVTAASSFLAERGMDAEKRAYDLIVLTDELRLYARLLDRASPEYVAAFLSEAGGFLAQAHPGALQDAPAFERLRWTLIGEGAAAEVVELARFAHTEAAERPAITVRGGPVEGDLPFRERKPRLPRELFRYDQELTLETRVTGFEVDEQQIAIEGWAHLRHVAVPKPVRKRLRIWLVEDGGSQRIELAVEPRACPEATAQGVPDLYDLDGAGFRATIATEELTGRWRSGVDRWKVAVEVRGGAAVRTGRLAGPLPGAPRRPPAVDVGKLRVGPRIEGDLVDIVVSARPVTISDAEVVEGTLRLELISRRALTQLRLRRTGVADRLLPVERLGAERFGVAISARELTSSAFTPQSYVMHALDEAGKVARLLAGDHLDQQVVADGARELALDISRYGYAGLAVRPASLWLEAAEVADGSAFRVSGRYRGPDAGSLRIEIDPRDRIDARRLPVTVGAGGGSGVGGGVVGSAASAGGDAAARLSFVVPFVSAPSGEPTATLSPAPLPAGLWRVRASVPDGGEARREVEVRFLRSFVADLPLQATCEGKQVSLDDRGWQQAAVTVSDDLAVDERGRCNQRRLWSVAAKGSRRRLDATVVVVAGDGRSSGGCARAVAEELRRHETGLTVLWSVRDRQVEAPPGTQALRLGGREWHKALARATAVVADTPLPRTFEPTSRQRSVRLWNGVPIRPVGAEAPGVPGAEQPADATRAWSHLVTAGPDASTVLTHAFGFDGELLEVGLPRHDVLADPAAARERGAALRASLGIAADAPLVVHLPTWVDSDRHPGGGLRLTTDVDLPGLRAVAGPSGWLLARAHPAVVDTVAAANRDPQVLDVSRLPDVVGLLLAADVVVAHPSSVVLEAVRCGTPVVVHDPAGAGIATQLGTPYRDLVGPGVPWPVVHRDEELREAVRGILADPAAAARVAAGIAADTALHGELTGGGAAAAVVDRLLS